MIGTEFLKGQGLGNQLFAYVTARCLADALGEEFGTAGQDRMGVNIHSDKGMYFMDIDLGKEISDEEVPGNVDTQETAPLSGKESGAGAGSTKFTRYDEAEARLYAANSASDLKNGVYVAGADPVIKSAIAGASSTFSGNTLIYGNLQDESYFIDRIDKVKSWLRIKPEYDSYEYSKDNLCIINMRGGEYTGSPELHIGAKYFKNAIKHMKSLNPDMQFMIVTDDVESAGRVLPGIEAHHFDVAKDYITLKNAKYLIVSNSSFSVLAACTSDTLTYAIAPKYWARFNVSDGYWASEQNIYSVFNYMERKGNIFTADECRRELTAYKETSAYKKRINKKPTKVQYIFGTLRYKARLIPYWGRRIIKAVLRRLK